MSDKITTFDGKEWLIEDLEKKAIDDSFYTDTLLRMY